MSARVTAPIVLGCLRAAAASLTEDMGNGLAVRVTGNNPSTILRRSKRGGWDDEALAALIAHEFQERGSSRILGALAALRDAARLGDPAAVLKDASDSIARNAGAIQEDNAALADGALDRREKCARCERLQREIHERERELGNLRESLRLEAADARA